MASPVGRWGRAGLPGGSGRQAGGRARAGRRGFAAGGLGEPGRGSRASKARSRGAHGPVRLVLVGDVGIPLQLSERGADVAGSELGRLDAVDVGECPVREPRDSREPPMRARANGQACADRGWRSTRHGPFWMSSCSDHAIAAPRRQELRGDGHVAVLVRPAELWMSGMPRTTVALRAARMASSFWAAAAMVVSIAATSPSQPCSFASASRADQLRHLSHKRS